MKNVAIVVVCYNRRELLLKNLAAIAELRYSDYDTIVFDNGSTDGTSEAVREKHPHVLYHYSKENLGGAGGFAAGMAFAIDKGYTYVWCLDDDGKPHTDALGTLIHFAEHKDPCILGPRIVPIEQPEGWFWPIQGPYSVSNRQTQAYTPSEKKQIQETIVPFKTTSVALVGLFIHNAVVRQIGLPNKDLFVSNDDVEYCLRAQKMGFEVWQVPNALVFHPAMNTGAMQILGRQMTYIIMPAPKLYYYIRNIVYVNKKYFRPSIYFKMLVALLFTTIGNTFYGSASLKPIRYALKGFWDGWIGRLGPYNATRAKN